MSVGSSQQTYYVSRVKIRNFMGDINFWVTFFSYVYFSFTEPRYLLLYWASLSSPSLSLIAFSCFALWGLLRVVSLFLLTCFHLHFAWCRFLFSLVFICIFVFTGFSRVHLAPFLASSTFVWRAQVPWLSRLNAWLTHFVASLFKKLALL